PALKNGTFLAGTATVAPVLGFRPSFIRRARSRKLPNPRISVLSPFFTESPTKSKIVLTTISACRFVKVVTCSDTRSMIWAFVILDSPFVVMNRPAVDPTALERHDICETDPGVQIQFGKERRQSRIDQLSERKSSAWLNDFRHTLDAGHIRGTLDCSLEITEFIHKF